MSESRANSVSEYQFGRCRINVESREVRRDDELAPIEPKAFDLLVYLNQIMGLTDLNTPTLLPKTCILVRA